MSDFGPDEIRLGEAVYRSEAHLEACCELYGAGRRPDALLQAARPMTDVLPWLETEIRYVGDVFKSFYSATSALGGAIRGNRPPRALRRALKSVRAARAALLEAAVGTAASEPAYLLSVGLALLEGAVAQYRRAVGDEDLGEYQSAYALARMARRLFHDAGAARDELERLLSSVAAVWPAVDPPERLTRPEDVERLVKEIARVAEGFGARQVSWTLTDSVRKVDRLLGDVVVAYERGDMPLAARLAASLFVRSYDPIRKELAGGDPDAEARLTTLLGFELRRAINDKAPPMVVRDLAGEAHAILETHSVPDNVP